MAQRRTQKLIHPYLLTKKVGEGQFGVVWYAIDTNTNAPRAVKGIPVSKVQGERA